MILPGSDPESLRTILNHFRMMLDDPRILFLHFFWKMDIFSKTGLFSKKLHFWFSFEWISRMNFRKNSTFRISKNVYFLDNWTFLKKKLHIYSHRMNIKKWIFSQYLDNLSMYWSLVTVLGMIRKARPSIRPRPGAIMIQ